MERVENVNPNRLKMCCQELGITLDALALAVTVPLDNIQRVMDGAPGITINQLRKIADYFGRGILFFLETGDADPTQIHSPQFRTINNQKTNLSAKLRRLIERAERQRQAYLDLREELGEPPVKFQPPNVAKQNVSEVASKVRQWLGLSTQRDFASYREAVEDRGVLVFRSNGYSGKWQVPKDEGICGFSLYFKDSPLIFVRKQASESRQTFTLMHELGHLLLHRQSFVDDDDDLVSYAGKEKQANEFAGQLLVPDSVLVAIDDAKRPSDITALDDWLKPFTKTLGVSTQVLLIRLQQASRIPFPVYSAYMEWKDSLPVNEADRGSRAYRYKEPVHLFGDNFVRTVLDSVHSKNISLAKASGYLDNIKITDVHKLDGAYADF